MLYLIDIVGTCNLRCPSCPVANFKNKLSTPRPKGFMPFELFQKIIYKIKAESAALNIPPNITLYNWGEAFIHPQINDFLRFLNAENIIFSISTNFNTKMDLNNLVECSPAMVRVSVSGFHQKTYEKNHKGGNIETVKNNLVKLRELMNEKIAQNQSLPPNFLNVHIFYLVYKDNCDENIFLMHEFTKNLGFDFYPGLAYLMPLENMIYALDSNQILESDKEILNRLCFTPREAFELTKNENIGNFCNLLENQVVIDFDGSAALCCGVYDPQFSKLANFLEIDLPDLQKLRRQNPLCRLCIQNKIHAMAMQAPINVYNRELRRKQTEWRTPFWVNLGAFYSQNSAEPFFANPMIF